MSLKSSKFQFYFIARYLGISTIESFTKRSFDLSNKYQEKSAGWFVFLSRLIPVLPFGFISYGLGLARFPLKSYLLGTLLGMTPPTLLLSYLGESFTTSVTQGLMVLAVVLVFLLVIPLTLRNFIFSS